MTKVGAEAGHGRRLLALIAGMFRYTQIPVDGSYASDLLPGYLLVGFALAFTFIPVSIAALAGVKPHEAGLASGLYNTTNQVGGAIGVAVASSVAISHFNHLVASGDPGAQAQSAATSGRSG